MTAQTSDNSHRHTPSIRMLAAVVFTQARIPVSSASSAVPTDTTGPHVNAIVPPTSKNVGSLAERVRRSSASIASIVPTTFSPEDRSVPVDRRSGVSRAV